MQKCTHEEDLIVNWDDYRYFLSVARLGQLTRAGRQLGVDHATVSRRVKALEKRLGTKLFDASPKGYALTRDGAALLNAVESMESASIDAETVLGKASDETAGTVRIGVPDGVGAYIVTDAVIALRQKHPGLTVQMVAVPQNFSLAKREVDLAISVSRPRSARARIRKISDYHLHLYAHRQYLDRHPPITCVDDLKHHPGVGYIPELLHDSSLNYLPLVGADFELKLCSTSVHVQLHAILKGAGLGIVHDFMAQHHRELVPVLPESVAITRSFWLSVHEDYANVDRVRRTIDTLVDVMKEHLAGGLIDAG